MDDEGIGELWVVGEVGSSSLWGKYGRSGEMRWGVWGGKGRCGKMCWGCGECGKAWGGVGDEE